MLINIKRFEHSNEEGNRGVILIDGEFFAFSIECPELFNTQFKSRIPEGTYKAERKFSTKFGEVFYIQGVPNRYGIILFHVGNTKKDFQGCIGAGDSLHQFENERGVTNTRSTCKAFISKMVGYDEITVIIENV